MGPVRLIVLQATPFCNIDCSYCYLPDRGNSARISGPVLEALARKLVAEKLLESSVEVCWHAGEPLTVPPAHYDDLIDTLARVLGSAVEIQYSLQTNGTLVNDEWCKYFLRRRIRVGVSIDGPKYIHDQCRRDRRGIGTFDRVMKGIERLHAHGIRPYAICVLRRPSLPYPDEIFDFFQSIGIEDVCFNIEEIEAANPSSSLSDEQCYGAAVQYFRRYFELVAATENAHWCREFAYTLRRLCARSVHNAQITPLEMITVAADGTYSTLSPELIGMRKNGQPAFTLGHVSSAKSIRQSAAEARWLKLVSRGVELCREQCKYFDVCGGGAPSNKIAENKTFVSAETLGCRFGVQAPIQAMLQYFHDRPPLAAGLRGKGDLARGSFGDLRIDAK